MDGGNIALVNPRPPHNVTVLLNNYYRRQFNSLNDVKIHPSSKLFFTDQVHGFLHNFRDVPPLTRQVYRFDLDTGAVRVVATDFDKSNGITFAKDGRTAYVGDTGASRGFLGNNQIAPATMYDAPWVLDTLLTLILVHTFVNRRVLGYIDAGFPGGIQVDLDGNVFAACADGVQVFAPDGT